MAYRSSATAKSDTSATITATPAGVVANDILIGAITNDGLTASFTNPSGWTNGATLDLATGDTQQLHYAYKVATGTDAFGFGCTQSWLVLQVTAHSGRDTASPFSTAAVSTDQGAAAIASGGTTSITGITASAGDDIVVMVVTDAKVSGDLWASAPPTNYTERQDDATTNWSSLSTNTRDNVSAGATGSLVTTLTRTAGTGTTGYGAWVFALKQAAGSVALSAATAINLLATTVTPQVVVTY